MKSALLVICLSFAAIAFASTPRGVAAAPPRVPGAAYPHGAHISYRPLLSNHQIDCMWGFLCEGKALLFHLTPQDALHRLDGWGQFAGLQRGSRTVMAFELFASRYDAAPDELGSTWSERAFEDLRDALLVKGYTLLARNKDLPSTARGGSLTATEYLGRDDLVVMAAWSDDMEIEGIASYRHGSAVAKRTAWASLKLQIRHALARNS